MRATGLVLLALLVLPAGAAAQEQWLRDYKDGKEAFERKNWALAEQKFRSARDHPRAPTTQSRSVRPGGSLFSEEFIPDFYLGLVAGYTGRHQEAIRLLDSALARGLVTQRQANDYKLAAAQLEASRAELTRLANAAKPPGPTTVPSTGATVGPVVSLPGPTTTPGRPGPVTPAEPPWLAGFRRAMDAGRSALQQRRYADARSQAVSARQVAGDAPSQGQADALRREIETAQDDEELRTAGRAREAIRARNADGAEAEIATLEGFDPQHPALGPLRNDVQGLRSALAGAAAISRTERDGIRLYFAGNYPRAAATFQKSVTAGVTSPRIHLYLACSQAAMALLADPAQNAELVKEARRQYSLARPTSNTFTRDRQFISPRILELLAAGG